MSIYLYLSYLSIVEKTYANYYWMDVMVVHSYNNVIVNYIVSNNDDAEVDSSNYYDDVIK